MGCTTVTDLKQEQALARRWLRGALLPLNVWQWLAGRNTPPKQGLPTASPLIRRILLELSQPLGADSNTQETQALDNCMATVAELLTLSHACVRGTGLACQERMLAATLLPLYRGLASGSIAEVTSVLRRQLADAVVLATLTQELGPDLEEVLCHGLIADRSPYQLLKDKFDIELELLTQVLLVSAQRWDGHSLEQLDTLVREQMQIDWRPAWGASGVLWRLAGELIAQRAEFVVPRDWINVPVPWNEASEHWLDVVHALAQTPAICLADQTHSGPTDQVAINEETEFNRESATGKSTAASDKTKTDSDQPTTMQVKKSLNINAAEIAGDDIQRLKIEIEIANTVDSLVQATRQANGTAVGNRTDASHQSPTPRPRSDEFVVPKIIIAEVRSHNDPAFVSAVRRQLALCRSEERTMALIAVTVEPDGDEENMPTLQSLGLASWQQKLVNWLSDHPDISEPHAFLSNEGELILSLMDMERNAATAILRQGLIAVLNGSSPEGTLGRAPLPARYHSGIGSVASPTAGFEPEQLIEATYRCLDAAARLGKASIKSIEVF